MSEAVLLEDTDICFIVNFAFNVNLKYTHTKLQVFTQTTNSTGIESNFNKSDVRKISLSGNLESK